MPFEFKALDIEDVILITPKVFVDDRGFFEESYKKSEFKANGIDDDFVQDNHSKSTKGVLRGLHYQANPKAQAKLIRCISGKILDVAVDIRKNSPTFGQWVSSVLSADNKKMLYIPSGFAHGFCVLSDVAEILYKTSSEYCPQNDRGILWNDPEIAINWGLEVDPILSEKDKIQPKLKDVKVEDLL